MTTPLPSTPGDRREDTAITIGQVIADTYTRAELTLWPLAMLARHTATVLSAAWRLQRSLGPRPLTAAAEHTRTVLNEAAAAVTARVRAQVTADLGTGSSHADRRPGHQRPSRVARRRDHDRSSGERPGRARRGHRAVPLPTGTGVLLRRRCRRHRPAGSRSAAK